MARQAHNSRVIRTPRKPRFTDHPAGIFAAALDAPLGDFVAGQADYHTRVAIESLHEAIDRCVESLEKIEVGDWSVADSFSSGASGTAASKIAQADAHLAQLGGLLQAAQAAQAVSADA